MTDNRLITNTDKIIPENIFYRKKYENKLKLVQNQICRP